MSVQISVKFKSHVRSDTTLRPLALQPSISEIIVKKEECFFFFWSTVGRHGLSECCDMCVSASDIKCLFLYFFMFHLYAVRSYSLCDLVCFSFVQHFDTCIIESYEVSAGREEINIYLNLFV